MTEEDKKSQTKKSELKKSSDKKPADGPYSFLRLALSGIAIFAAVAYVLGRFHTEAYYSTLGIPPGMLSFGAEYYMFSSIDLVIICAIVSLILYQYYRLVTGGVRRFLVFPLYPEWKDKEHKIMDIVGVTSCIGLSVLILVSLYLGRGVGKYVPGATGASVGLALGIATVIYIRFLDWLTGARRPYSIFILGALLLIGFLPSISGNLAEIEAKADMQTFPKAVLICEDSLIHQLQSSPQNANESVEVRIITTSNDMTYVLKQDADLTDEWQVYGIKNDNIEAIIFTEKSG